MKTFVKTIIVAIIIAIAVGTMLRLSVSGGIFIALVAAAFWLWRKAKTFAESLFDNVDLKFEEDEDF